MHRIPILIVLFSIVITGKINEIIDLACAKEQVPTQVIQLSIRNGELVAPSDVIKVTQGTELTLIIASDKPLTLHLHGYDIVQTIIPGNPQPMVVKTFATGRYPIKVHSHAHEQQDHIDDEHTLGYLEVYPE